VAVPAGDVLRVKTRQLARLDDHVFEHLVDGMADMDLPVGVGRAVVQDELGRTGAGVAQALVEALLFPLLDPAGFALGQVAPHRKRCVGQVEGVAEVGAGRGGRCGVGVGHK